MLSLASASCGGRDESATSGGNTIGAANVEGTDLSGNYFFKQLECYAPDTKELTLVGTFSNYAETVHVKGNTFTSILKGGNCTFTTNGKIVFNETGTYTASDSKVTVPGGNCKFTTDLSLVGDQDSTVESLEVSYTDGQVLPPETAAFVKDSATRALGLEKPEIGAEAGQLCFMVYLPS